MHVKAKYAKCEYTVKKSILPKCLNAVLRWFSKSFF